MIKEDDPPHLFSYASIQIDAERPSTAIAGKRKIRRCKLANDDSGILGIMLLSKQASEAALYAGGVVHLPELPAVPPAELSEFRYHHSQVYSVATRQPYRS